VRSWPFVGAGGLAAANQIYNALKAKGRALNTGDIAIVDVSGFACDTQVFAHQCFLASRNVFSLFTPSNTIVPHLLPQSNKNHDYQPGWTIVGSGLADKNTYRRPLSSLIPGHFAHVHARAAGFEPESNEVVLEDGFKVGYEWLVVAPGIQTSEHLPTFHRGPLAG